MDIQLRSDFDVDLIDSMGNDSSIVRAARVSTVGAESRNSESDHGLINYLMRERHGSPFEHTALTYYVSAPIFVFREFQRHRIASYNEQSGRYMELDPVFYIPDYSRPLIQTGKTGHYEFEEGTQEQHQAIEDGFNTATELYGEYRRLLSMGVAKEVARMILPLNIYSSMYVTMNVRALCNFLSLRTKDLDSKFPSYPQHEIELVARDMEAYFRSLYPITWEAWDRNGRVAP